MCLDLESFKTSCKNLCDGQQEHGKVKANNFCYLGSSCKNFRGIRVFPTRQKKKQWANKCDWPKVCEVAELLSQMSIKTYHHHQKTERV